MTVPPEIKRLRGETPLWAVAGDERLLVLLSDAERAVRDADARARREERERLTGKRITHGRHCICSACAREDWTNPRFAPCGMHGPGCPQRYQPLGAAGDPVPAEQGEPE